MGKVRIDRRGFLRLSLTTTAGLVAAACGGPKPEPTTVPKPVETKAPGPTAAATSPASPASTVAPTKFKESPMLADLVKQGKLPPVEKRLPEKPLVQRSATVGQYGGTLYDQTSAPGGHFGIRQASLPCPMQTNNDGTEILPDLCYKSEFSADKKEFTLFFHKGLKWSDGTPFNVDDILWWWENEQNSKELMPSGPSSWWIIKGKPVQFEKIDDYTIKMKFPTPYRPALNMAACTIMGEGSFLQPVHWIKKFHIKFNPDADKLAKAEGFDYWYQLYTKYWRTNQPGAERPALGAWVKTECDTSHELYVRNAYYYEVDQEGNQLPYIDRWYVNVVPDASLRITRAVAGDVSIHYGNLADIAAFKANATKGDYTIYDWGNSSTSFAQLAFNLNHKDPVLNKIYNDVRFRRAMSLAINRHEINEKLFFGLAKEVQTTINDQASYFKPEWAKAYAEYDPAKANALLDEMGLKWDAEHKWRLRPDGKRLTTVLTFYREFDPAILEMVKNYWDAVGMETILREVQRALRDELGKTAQLDCTTWNTDRTEEVACYLPWATKFQPNTEMYYAVDWWAWWTSGGKQGVEPPQIWKDQFSRMEAWYTCTTDEEYKKLAQEVWGFFSEQVVCIGTVGYVPMPTLVKNGLMNAPKFLWKGYGTGHAKSHFLQTWWWKKA